ncbi:MAG: hypothetical protein H7A45_15630 [Verrucomicrobiales bacterium]|nr:hypothetical protein [Verrucomicrobiales bacterium]
MASRTKAACSGWTCGRGSDNAAGRPGGHNPRPPTRLRRADHPVLSSPGRVRAFPPFEIGVDGTNLRQLTDGPYDDYEPIHLPDGDLLFVSTRCRRWVNCWTTQVGTIHRSDPDGGHIRAISANTEHDNTPWMLPDGRVLYTRWEYVDRSQVEFHHLWSMNPDGTGQTVYYGNLRPTS